MLIYICKPFSLAQLAIRIEVVLRRMSCVTPSPMIFDRPTQLIQTVGDYAHRFDSPVSEACRRGSHANVNLVS
ncbi:hypothetical protein [Microcoleus sp. herbarium12]|uniref:hypothetical protein n=1 Tax=Microcoleus sp. herbarium12 TaxID=3055437 RepID=UPI002FD7225C